jgi:hypothetical protein
VQLTSAPLPNVSPGVEKRPGAHSWHCAAPGLSANVPRAQPVQTPVKADENVPAGHGGQIVAPDGSEPQNPVPGVHASHSTAPGSAAAKPARQGVQVTASESGTDPAGQSLQAVPPGLEPMVETRPGGHLVLGTGERGQQTGAAKTASSSLTRSWCR